MNRFTQLFIDTTTGRWLTQDEPYASSITSVTAVQTNANDTWVITHNKATNQFLIQIQDENNEEVFPDEVEITDLNTITVTFAEPMTGEANILFF